MLMIGGNMGVMRMTKEHLGLAISMQMPTYVIITKVDIAPEHVLQQTVCAPHTRGLGLYACIESVRECPVSCMAFCDTGRLL